MFEFLKLGKEPKKIEFGRTADYMDYPVPAASQIPKWYKNSPRLTYGNKPEIKNKVTNAGGNLGVKYCIPFLDTLTVGYVATLWQDLQVKRSVNGQVEFVWALDPNMVDGRNGTGFEELPIPAGHDEKQYVWLQPFSVKLPKGYSALYTHPLNRYDLPFITLSGIHDSDSLLPPGNFPFYLQEDFEGIIPRGTPLFQIIPFKRDNWIGEGNDELDKKAYVRSQKSTSMVSGFYKKFMWKKKEFDMKKEEE